MFIRERGCPRKIGILLIIAGLLSTAFAAEKGDMRLGVMVMLGARYDNMRLCVATGNGVKGGPVADIMLCGRYSLDNNIAIGFNLPVMRPILFGAAFKIVQFEPTVVLDITSSVSSKTDFVVSPGIGVSLHYGPDYTSGRNNRTPSFFAAGPIVNTLLGFDLKSSAGKVVHTIGIRPFYTPLFSKDHGIGTVLGGAFEYMRLF